MIKYIRTITKGKGKKKTITEVDVSLERDFLDDVGNRHPRQVLFLWSDDELWDVLQIKRVNDEPDTGPSSP